jgi:hypothetical protein
MVDRPKKMVDAMLPFARRGIAIVGLEPSCLLTLRDEMLVMGLGARSCDQPARTAAGRVLHVKKRPASSSSRLPATGHSAHPAAWPARSVYAVGDLDVIS